MVSRGRVQGVPAAGAASGPAAQRGFDRIGRERQLVRRRTDAQLSTVENVGEPLKGALRGWAGGRRRGLMPAHLCASLHKATNHSARRHDPAILNTAPPDVRLPAEPCFSADRVPIARVSYRPCAFGTSARGRVARSGHCQRADYRSVRLRTDAVCRMVWRETNDRVHPRTGPRRQKPALVGRLPKRRSLPSRLSRSKPADRDPSTLPTVSGSAGPASAR
jgi:hypothetical protein